MKILITGAGGLLGKNLLENIDYKKHKVIATSLHESKLKDFLKDKPNLQVIVKKLDIMDINSCKSLIKNVDVVVHLAALIDINLSLKQPKEFILTNYQGTLNVLEAMRLNKVKKIIFSSTQYIYGNNINIREDDDKKISPLNPYAFSKLICEEAIEMYSKLFGIKYIIFRASHLYGKYQKKGIVPLFLDRVKKNKKVEIGNNVKRDFFNAIDFANAIIWALSYKSGKFNLGTGKSTSLMDLINIISGDLGKKVEIVENKKLSRNVKLERWDEVANIKKIKKLGWSPKYELKKWLKENLD